MNDSARITSCTSCIGGITEYIKARNTLMSKRISYRDDCQGLTVAGEMDIN